MYSLISFLLTTGFLALGWASPAPGDAPIAQSGQDAPLAIQVGAEEGDPRLTLGPVLSSQGIRSSMERGLPVRIRVVTELWRQRFLDSQEARHEWRASVRFDPLARAYLVELGNGQILSAATLEEATAILSDQLQVPLRPDRSGRFYYLARLEVETLSLSDLDELRRWLQGDLAPAVEGEEGGGIQAALGRGLQRALIRVLGLPGERYQARSPTFPHPG